jgi:glucose/arabinose dehydrogenase
MRYCLRFVRCAVVGGVTLLFSPGAAPAASVPAGFTDQTIAGGLSAPTAMAFLPDGRLFVCQQGGAVRVVKNGALLPAPFVSLTVDSAGERGLIGIAVDPQFASNGFIYLHYTVPGSPSHNRVSRFTASGDRAVAGSEVVLLELDPLTSATNHNGGAIHFGPDGKLYVAVGENASGANAQTLSNRKGKILRLNANGSIPADNPFFASAAGANRAIWALGLRNPFTFAFDPPSGRMFINDVGQSAWEEIDLGVAGSNYGWPTTEGITSSPAFRGPLYAYGHGSGPFLGCAIAGGAFMPSASPAFPASYGGFYFFADLCGGWINARSPGGQVTSFAAGIVTPVDLQVGPDGALYYLARGGGGATGIVGRIAGPTPGALVTMDPAPSTMTTPFTLTGWTIDIAAAMGTGVDAVHVWAYPNPGSGEAPVFVGVAEYGRPRADVSARYGSRFAASGFAIPVRGLRPAPYLLVVFGRSTVTGTFNAATRLATVVTSPRMALDLPRNTSVVTQPFVAGGWALNLAAPAGQTGVDAVDLFASGPGGTRLIGHATYGVNRPDVAAAYSAYGPQFGPTGFQLSVRGLAPGTYTMTAAAHGTLSDSFEQSRAATVQVLPGTRMYIDRPRPGTTVSPGFLVAGWALDASAPSGTGIDAVHVWAYPASGAPPVFLGANAAFVQRPDVGAIFGPAFTPSGFQLQTAPLTPGSWQLVVFARSTRTLTFSQAVVVPIIVAAP